VAAKVTEVGDREGGRNLRFISPVLQFEEMLAGVEVPAVGVKANNKPSQGILRGFGEF
jgi:hypothetical protein